MRKTFPLKSERLKPARVIESVKRDVRKYLRRERKKSLPDGIDYWDFDCRVGKDSESAETVHPAGIIAAIDSASQDGWKAVYIEILAKPGRRGGDKPESPATE